MPLVRSCGILVLGGVAENPGEIDPSYGAYGLP
jgi:hypothetical protein